MNLHLYENGYTVELTFDNCAVKSMMFGDLGDISNEDLEAISTSSDGKIHSEGDHSTTYWIIEKKKNIYTMESYLECACGENLTIKLILPSEIMNKHLNLLSTLLLFMDKYKNTKKYTDEEKKEISNYALSIGIHTVLQKE